jgi:hypothetical protein
MLILLLFHYIDFSSRWILIPRGNSSLGKLRYTEAMLVILCPLSAEAEPLAAALSLTRGGDFLGHPLFGDEDRRLLVTGSGNTRAAALAAAYLSSLSPLSDGCLAVFGSAAGMRPERKEGLFRLSRIRSLAEGKDEYPSALIRLGTPGVSCLSGDQVLRSGERRGEEDLYDLESFGLFQAGSLFFHPDAMLFLRFVSDNGLHKPMTRKALAEQAQRYAPSAAAAVTVFQHVLEEDTAAAKKREADAYAEMIADRLHASLTMRRRLQQVLAYAELSGQNLAAAAAGIPETADKEEGKKVLHELERHFCL